jgi:hypothetical protein
MSSGFNPLQAAENPYDQVGAALAPLIAACGRRRPRLILEQLLQNLIANGIGDSPSS